MQKIKLPGLISILILTLLTAIVWVSFSVYRAFAVQPAPSVPKEISEPLSPTLDKDAIQKIESSIFLDSSQVPENLITVVASSLPVATPLATPLVTPTPTEQPVASESATPSPTP